MVCLHTLSNRFTTRTIGFGIIQDVRRAVESSSGLRTYDVAIDRALLDPILRLPAESYVEAGGDVVRSRFYYPGMNVSPAEAVVD